MYRIRRGIAVFSLAILAIFTVSGAVQAQQRINTKEVRDTIRDLNMKIVDFQNRLSYQLESSSSDQQQSDAVMNDLRQLQSRIRGFDQDVVARRDNRTSMECRRRRACDSSVLREAPELFPCKQFPRPTRASSPETQAFPRPVRLV